MKDYDGGTQLMIIWRRACWLTVGGWHRLLMGVLVVVVVSV